MKGDTGAKFGAGVLRWCCTQLIATATKLAAQTLPNVVSLKLCFRLSNGGL